MNPQAQTFTTGAIAASGDLQNTPFAELLVALLEIRCTGTLHVADEHGQTQARIRFDAGRPVAAQVARPEAELMQTLIPLCARSEGSYRFEDGVDALERAPGVVTGSVDPLALIAAAMRGPVREDAVNRTLADLGSTLIKLNPRVPLERYAFTQQERLALSMLFQGPVEALELQGKTEVAPHLLRRLVYVLAITRGITVLPAAHRGLSGTIAHAPPLPPPATHRPPRGDKPTRVIPLDAPFAPGQSGPVQAAGAQPSVGRADTRPLANGERARKSRLLTGANPGAQSGAGRYHVRNPSEGRTELRGAALEIGLPHDLPPALRLWGDEILERARLIARQNYYEALGVGRDCNNEQLEAAHQALIKRFDPDQLPPELECVLERAHAIVGHAQQAFEALCDPDRRREYDRELGAGSALGVRPSVQRGMQAEAHYRRAEALLKRKDYAGAQQEAERALSMASSCARYEALYGYLLFLRTGATGRVHPRARQHLEVAIKRDPRCEQAHYYMAVVLKQSGDVDKAYQHFKRVLKLNPGHLEATRETRLFEMRTKQGAGFLDRLLGRGASNAPKSPGKPKR